MLSWLAVSDSTSPMLSVSASWRRQGIGQFMFIFIIKQCAAFANGGNIDIFLQCLEPEAFRLYCMLGFQRLNSNHDNGFTLLPKSLQDVLFAVPPKKKKGGHRQST
jgi:GNAT superfamily N-acetyltransferase